MMLITRYFDLDHEINGLVYGHLEKCADFVDGDRFDWQPGFDFEP